MKQQSKTIGIVGIAIMVLLLALFIALTTLSVTANSFITMWRSSFSETGNSVLDEDFTWDTAVANTRDVSVRTMEEGAVLLRNRDNTLPLAKNSKVNLFGYYSVNSVLGSGGSSTVGSAGKIIFTENGIVNIALNLAKEKAERSGINTDIRAAVPRELKISDVELTSLLTNLSDNAIEGCLRVAPEKRMLEIVATYTNGYLTVRTVNSVDPDTVHMGKDGFVTAKEDKEKHGIGTRIIKKIAEGHSGCVRYEVKDGKFVADVMLKCDRA